MINYIIKPMITNEEKDGKAYVHFKSWQETYCDLIPKEKLITEEKCFEIAYKSPNNILIAKEKDKVIGFVGYGKYRDEQTDNIGEIFGIYVLSKYQGNKVGYELMNAAIHKLNEFSKIAIWVLEGNVKAIKFYEKYGFIFNVKKEDVLLGTKIRMIYNVK